MTVQPELISWINSSQSSAVDLLAELVSINSYTLNVDGVNRVQDVIAAFLTKLGMRVQRVPVSERGDILLAQTQKAAARRILLVGHSDTVHPPDSAFKDFRQESGRAFGPGVLDMKGGLVTMLWALKALHEKNLLHDIPVEVLINSDEEVGCPESHHIVESESRKTRAALVFEWGRANDGIILNRKGVGSFSIEVSGIASHAGNSHREGANAIVQLAHSIQRVSALTDYDHGITVNVGLVEGGSAINTVPESANAKVDLRIERLEDFSRMKQAIESAASEIVVPGARVDVTNTSLLPPMVETPESAALLESFRAFAAPAGLNYDKIPTILGGGSDANRTSAQGVPSIDGLGPLGEFAHSDKEYIVLDSLPKKTINLALWLASQAA